MKITNAIALATAYTNLSMTVNNGATLYGRDGVMLLSHEDSREVLERLFNMLETAIKRAESSKNRERKPTAKQIAAKAETVELAERTFKEMSDHPNFLYECAGIAETMGISTAKMARVLAILVADGKVERIEGKKPNFKVKGE